ncbi:MAG: Tmc redox complex protein TmcD [Desulfobacterales bacterium]|nr:Tmc redox complex protein TmcD [Desulfobacterales bacterium]
MEEKQSWDWSTELKEIPVDEWSSRFNWVEDPCITPDGESVAAVVNVDDMAFGICVNGELWEGAHEKAWHLTAFSDNRIAAAVCEDEEWSLVVDGNPWENRFDFIWNLSATPDGKHLSLAYQKDMEYGMAVDDTCWEDAFENMTGMTLGNSGKTAAVVQVAPMAAADINAFAQGLFSVAVNGQPGGERFINAWDISFDAGCENLAWAVRLDRENYSVAVNGTVWNSRFQQVWHPVFCGDSVVAPVRYQGEWQLFMDDKPFWTTGYANLWRLQPSGDGNHLAAIVAPEFGRWTVAEDDQVWPVSWDAMVRDIHYSDDKETLLAVYKDGGSWGLAQNGVQWNLTCDKIFTPDMNRDGSVVAVAFEKDGQHFVSVNDRVLAGPYETMADPVVSPGGDKVLIKGVENGVYKRTVIPL